MLHVMFLQHRQCYFARKGYFQAWTGHAHKIKSNAMSMIQSFIWRYHCAKKLKEQEQLMQRENDNIVKSSVNHTFLSHPKKIQTIEATSA